MSDFGLPWNLLAEIDVLVSSYSLIILTVKKVDDIFPSKIRYSGGFFKILSQTHTSLNLPSY